MTQDRDFDRIARAWLETGPDVAPDRAVAAVLTAVDATPQIGRPWRWSSWRPITMTPRTFSLIGVLLLALVLSLSMLTGGHATPSPTPAPAASPAVPPSAYLNLVGQWAGTPRTLGGSGHSDIVRGFFSQPGEWMVSGSMFGPLTVQSTVAMTASDRLTLTTTTAGRRCSVGDVGTYHAQLSPGMKRLTLTVEADPCLDRITATQGTWIRNECTTTSTIAGGDSDCYGPLEAGTYPSRGVNLRFDISNGVVAPVTFDALTFTVPDGWSHVADNSTRFWLMPTPQYARLHDGQPHDGLYVFGHPQVASRAVGCPYEPQPGTGLSSSEIMNYLMKVPSLTLSEPQAITVNGRTGLWSDVELAPAWTKSCDWHDGSPIAPILYANTGLSGVARGARERLIVLDIGHGDSVAIEIFTPDAGRFDALMGDAMRIVQSFVFAEPDTSN